MYVNFNEEEAILMLGDGIQLVLQKEQAIELAKDILDYFDEGDEDEFE